MVVEAQFYWGILGLCECSASSESHSTIALAAEMSFKEVESSDAQLSPHCENESFFFCGSDKQTGLKMSNIQSWIFSRFSTTVYCNMPRNEFCWSVRARMILKDKFATGIVTFEGIKPYLPPGGPCHFPWRQLVQVARAAVVLQGWDPRWPGCPWRSAEGWTGGCWNQTSSAGWAAWPSQATCWGLNRPAAILGSSGLANPYPTNKSIKE